MRLMDKELNECQIYKFFVKPIFFYEFYKNNNIPNYKFLIYICPMNPRWFVLIGLRMDQYIVLILRPFNLHFLNYLNIVIVLFTNSVKEIICIFWHCCNDLCLLWLRTTPMFLYRTFSVTLSTFAPKQVARGGKFAGWSPRQRGPAEAAARN